MALLPVGSLRSVCRSEDMRTQTGSFLGATARAGEHPQSAARDPGLSTGTDFIASPLHCLVRYFLSLGGVTDQSLSESRHQHRQDHDRRESPDRGDARGIAPPASADWRHQRLIHRPADEHAQTGNRSRTQSARDDTGVATHGGTYGRCECVFWLALFSALQQIQPNHDGNEYAQCRDHNRRHNEISIVDEEFHRSTSTLANGGDQRLAAKGLSTPPDFIASPLDRLVRPTNCYLF